MSVDDTDKYGEEKSDDDESSDGGPSKAEPPAARSRAGAMMAKQPVERMCKYATEQPHKYKLIIVNGQKIIIKRLSAKVINLATSKTMINKDSRANWWQTPIEECFVAVSPWLAGGRKRMSP